MLTAIDQVANRHHLQLIKAAIPYIPASSQRPIALFIKMTELQNVLQFFRSAPNTVQASEADTETANITEMLADIRGYCDESEQAAIDQLGQLFSMLELYSALAGSPSDAASFFSGFQGGDANE